MKGGVYDKVEGWEVRGISIGAKRVNNEGFEKFGE